MLTLVILSNGRMLRIPFITIGVQLLFFFTLNPVNGSRLLLEKITGFVKVVARIEAFFSN